MFDNVRIRTKLIAIVAAPLAALLVLIAIGGFQRRADADQAGRDADRIEVTERATTLAHAIQAETLVTTAFLGAREKVEPADVGVHRKASDEAVSAYRRSLRQVSDLQVADRGAVDSVQGQIEFLSGLREQVDRGETGWSEIQGQYFIFDDALQDLIAAFGAGINDPELATRVRSLGVLAGYASAAAREGSVFTGVLAEGSFSDQQRNGREVSGEDLQARYSEAVEGSDVQLAVYTAGASAGDRTLLRNRLSGTAFDLIDSAREEAAVAAFGKALTTDPVEYRRAIGFELDVLRAIETTQAGDLLGAAQSQLDAASRSAQFFLVLGICFTLIVIVLAGIVSSSITRPLSRLTLAVDQVATQQLPRLVESLRNPAEDDVKLVADAVTDIEPGGGAELEHLGRAVTSIQHVAVEVATEQASLLRKGIGDMFVNLARRNQALLDRQIEFIDQLEVDEEDPDRLDDLFKLDHMATRMRRNAESLLVLAGAEPARRRGRPVPLADVVRAALGEVEDYTRIDLLTLDEVLIKSTGAMDTAHLLSELMENATHFSPPDTRVEIVGHRTRSDGYVVSVTDHGIGMTPDQMADANELLANPPLVGLAMSRSLGFIVIGRLAARIGVTVKLIPSPTGGVTGIVSLPSTIVEDTLARGEEPADTRQDDEQPERLADAVPAGYAFDDALATLVDESAQEAQADAVRNHPSQWAEPAEPPRSGPQRHPSSVEGETERDPDELPVRRPRSSPSDAPLVPEPTAAVEPEPQPDAAPVAEPPTVRSGLFGGGAEAAPSNLPEPLLDAGGPDDASELPPLTRRPASVDRPPTDGLFSARNGDGVRPNGSRSPESAPRLFSGSERPPLPMPGGAKVPDPQTGTGADAPAPAVVERTASGLTRRTPRAAGETARPRPGGDGAPRGATTTGRSPDEVRAMLSRFRTGQQQAAGAAREDRARFRDLSNDVDRDLDPSDEDL